VTNPLYVRLTPQGVVSAALLDRFKISLSDPLFDLLRQQFREQLERGMAGGYASTARVLREHDLNKAAELIEKLFAYETTEPPPSEG
jgi:hypothetical protein